MPEPPKLNYQKDGHFIRPDSAFRNFVSKDPNSPFPAEKGRYALYLAPTCPWAHRTLIVRAMKRLEDVIDLYLLNPFMGPEGWFFDGALPQDPLYGFRTLRQLYRKVDPDYGGRVTVPVLWDKKTATLVNNESSEIIRMLYSEFDAFVPEALREASKPAGGFYPAHLRSEIDDMNGWVYHTVNNGVYKAGFATTQAAHDGAVYPLFASLDRLEAHLADRGTPFLLGNHVTEADVRLYTTLVRFDVAYHSVFMCNLKSVRHNYPHLHLWLRRLYWDDGAETGGAFYRTTQPWIGMYAQGYAKARHTIVHKGQGEVVFPRGPAVPIEPLGDGEKL
ncbi:glutathione S-transferase [Xylariaceae sp. FL0662B]|nr:glutathione S-transferase [Xylariaceae sp. FL0662B]